MQSALSLIGIYLPKYKAHLTKTSVQYVGNVNLQ